MLFNPFTGGDVKAQIRAYMIANHPSIAVSQRIGNILDPQGVFPITISTPNEPESNKIYFIWSGTSQWGGSRVIGP